MQKTFGVDVVTFVPPGGVWTEDTERYAVESGLKYLTSDEFRSPTGKQSNGLTYIGADVVTEFHDREAALYGIDWFRKLLATKSGRYVTISEYCKHEAIVSA